MIPVRFRLMILWNQIVAMWRMGRVSWRVWLTLVLPSRVRLNANRTRKDRGTLWCPGMIATLECRCRGAKCTFAHSLAERACARGGPRTLKTRHWLGRSTGRGKSTSRPKLRGRRLASPEVTGEGGLKTPTLAISVNEQRRWQSCTQADFWCELSFD